MILNACDGCRQSRVRCSRQLPYCERCYRRRIPCVYTERKYRYFKSISTNKIEKFISRFKCNPNLNSISESNTQPKEGAYTKFKAVKNNKKELKELKSVKNSDSELTKVTVDSLLNSEQTTISRLAEELLNLNISTLNDPKEHMSKLIQGSIISESLKNEELDLRRGIQCLFQPEFWDLLLHLYFHRYNAYFNFVDEDQFYRSRASCHPALLAAMYYVGYLYARVHDDIICRFIWNHVQIQIEKVFYQPCQASITALLILGLVGLEFTITTKRYIEQAIRLAQSIGLHRKVSKLQTLQNQRNIIWNSLVQCDLMRYLSFNFIPVIDEHYFTPVLLDVALENRLIKFQDLVQSLTDTEMDYVRYHSKVYIEYTFGDTYNSVQLLARLKGDILSKQYTDDQVNSKILELLHIAQEMLASCFHRFTLCRIQYRTGLLLEFSQNLLRSSLIQYFCQIIYLAYSYHLNRMTIPLSIYTQLIHCTHRLVLFFENPSVFLLHRIFHMSKVTPILLNIYKNLPTNQCNEFKDYIARIVRQFRKVVQTVPTMRPYANLVVEKVTDMGISV